MRVRVLFFGVLRDRAGHAEQMVELGAEARVRDLLDWARTLPGLGDLVGSMAVAVNLEYVGVERGLCEGDEVALLPPVSGGGPRGNDSTRGVCRCDTSFPAPRLTD